MFCQKCGSKLPEGAMFCNKCGQPVPNANAQNGMTNNKMPVNYNYRSDNNQRTDGVPDNRMDYNYAKNYQQANNGYVFNSNVQNSGMVQTQYVNNRQMYGSVAMPYNQAEQNYNYDDANQASNDDSYQKDESANNEYAEKAIRDKLTVGIGNLIIGGFWAVIFGFLIPAGIGSGSIWLPATFYEFIGVYHIIIGAFLLVDVSKMEKNCKNYENNIYGFVVDIIGVVIAVGYCLLWGSLNGFTGFAFLEKFIFAVRIGLIVFSIYNYTYIKNNKDCF
jgi:hypothetical protein